MFGQNQILHDKMIAQGYRFHRGENYEHYVDSEGNYVAYPNGYVRIHFDIHFNQIDYIFSVQSSGGWWQRRFFSKFEGEKWAEQKQKELLSQDEDSTEKLGIL